MTYPADFINQIICGDCLEVMKQIPDKSIDLVLTDPPYGINKAEWDKIYPRGFEKECLRIGKTVAIMCGQWAIPKCLQQIGDSYLSIICLDNRNGMTFSPIGFGNWIPVIIAGEKPKKRGRDLLSFVVKGKKPEHPSPKPIDAMLKIIDRLSECGDTILDPFMGSGTTGVTCKELGRNFIGIEINEEYFKIAEKRINQTMGSLF